VSKPFVFRSSFAKDYGLEIVDGPSRPLLAAIIVLDENNKVIYSEQVPEITQEPDYIKRYHRVEVTFSFPSAGENGEHILPPPGGRKVGVGGR